QGRAGAYQPARPAPGEQSQRRRQGRRQGQGQAAGHGRARQSAPVDEGGRSGDRRRPGSQAEGRAATGRRGGVTAVTATDKRAARTAALFICDRAAVSTAVGVFLTTLSCPYA